MEDLFFAAKYLLTPKNLQYENEYDEVLLQFLLKKGDKDHVKKVLLHSSLPLYLQLIAKKTRKSILDKDVLEAYFFGSELTAKVTAADIKAIIALVFKKDKDLQDKLLKHISSSAIPTHNFHLFHIHHATNGILNPISNIDLARIAVAKVEKVEKSHLLVEYQPLSFQLGKMMKHKTQKLHIQHPPTAENFRKQDLITMRWKNAIEKIDKKTADTIQKYTARAIDAFR